MGFNLKVKSEVKQVVIDNKLNRINKSTATNRLNDLMNIAKMDIVTKGSREIKNDIFQAKKELNIQGSFSADMQRPGRKKLNI